MIPTPPRRRTRNLKRGRLNKVSARRKREGPARKRCIAAVRERDGNGCFAHCCPDCTSIGTDPHELVRRGQCGSIVDPKNVRLICRPCHIWIGNHPRLAHERGLHVWSWEENK